MGIEEDKFLRLVKEIIHISWSITLGFVWTFFYGFLILGSSSAILLLIKLYPTIAIQLFNPMIIFLAGLIIKLFGLFLGITISLSILSWIIKLSIPYFENMKVIRKQKQDQFKKDLIKEIKEGVRNARRK